nr:glutamate--cysteine ligase [Thiococcus pfennigii]
MAAVPIFRAPPVNDRYETLERRLNGLAQSCDPSQPLVGLIGLEKEGLRVAAPGTVAMTGHPVGCGSPLTHPYITTDFSEALLELITPPLPSGRQALDFLRDLHGFVYRHIDDELIWAASMPCVLEGDRPIPLARYGRSNAARMKTVYRRGLGNRYGRTMQIIAGVHFNFSFADALWARYRALEDDARAPREFRDDLYMGLIRNLQRVGWLVPYLFGASPAVCKSFLQGRAADLCAFDEHTAYAPYATSLRMGDIGYQNQQEEGTGMKANYDSLDSYVRSLTWAIETPCPHYEHIGVKVGGRYEQLNANVLQIENEYYSTVRPKQVTGWMERPTLALHRRGITYIELRSMDVNAFAPLGVDEEQIDFLRVLALFCLLHESPRISARERRAIDRNQVLTAHRGRDPDLRLERDGAEVRLRDWAVELLDAMAPIAALLDGGRDGPCRRSLASQREKVCDATLTPSARMLAEMRAHGEGFAQFARRLSEAHRDWFRARALAPERLAEFERLTVASEARQAEIEAADTEDFDSFLARYFAQRFDNA